MCSILPGSCSYAGMGYANPHAVTSVGGTTYTYTYTYDNNGNVSAIGSLDYTWDWRNRLASAERSGGGFTSYGYDHTSQRMFQATGSATTSYPNRYYNVASSTLTANTDLARYGKLTEMAAAGDEGDLLPARNWGTEAGAVEPVRQQKAHPDHVQHPVG